MAAPPIDAGTLYRRHAPSILRFLRRLGAGDESDDLLQEVFVTAHRRGGYREGAMRETSWLFGIAIECLQNDRRKRSRRASIDQRTGAVEPSLAASPQEIIESRDSVRAVLRALDALSDEQRAVFVLFEIEGEECETIARLLEVPVGTVHSRLFNGRRRFFAAFESQSRRDAPAQERQP